MRTFTHRTLEVGDYVKDEKWKEFCRIERIFPCTRQSWCYRHTSCEMQMNILLRDISGFSSDYCYSTEDDWVRR